jgi:taurine dioxygenase
MTMFEAIPMAPFGVELVGADLSRPLSAADGDAFVHLYEQHHLVLARGQRLDVGAQVALMELLGPVLRDAYDGGATYVSKDPDVLGQPRTGVIGRYSLSWHSDGMYVPHPMLALSLHAVDVAEGIVVPTRFASGAGAFRHMPPDLQERIRPLEAYFVRPHSMVTRNRLADLEDFEPRQIRPVVGSDHHGTGVPVIWPNFQHTDGIVGLDPDESERLVEEIFEYLYSDDNVLVHGWRNGDIVIWDNLAVQHSRDELPDDGTPRALQRVTVETVSFGDQMFPGWSQTAVSSGGAPAGRA